MVRKKFQFIGVILMMELTIVKIACSRVDEYILMQQCYRHNKFHNFVTTF